MTDNDYSVQSSNFQSQWYSTKQIATSLGVRISSVNHRVNNIRRTVGFLNHERILETPINGKIYSVLFYDVYGVFLITSKMRLNNPRISSVFFAGLDMASASLIGDVSKFREKYQKCIETIASAYQLDTGRAGFVYLLRSQNGLCKIGMTIDPITRIRALELEHGTLEKLALIECDDRWALEHKLHVLYADKRHHLEWFSLSQEDIEHIQSHSY